MVKVMYNDKLLYNVVIWVFCVISLWKEKEALSKVDWSLLTKTWKDKSISKLFGKGP